MHKLYVLFFCLVLGNPVFTSAQQKMIAFKAASNLIQYTGRFEIVDSGYLKTSAPGAYINFTFEGPDCKLKILKLLRLSILSLLFDFCFELSIII